jgi:KDO2-lipid IV(A) lauroyltransferase
VIVKIKSTARKAAGVSALALLSSYRVLCHAVRRIAQYFDYLLLRWLMCLAQALPLSLCHNVVALLATACNDVLRLRRGVIDANLRHAFPDMNGRERRRLARGMWEHLLLFAAEVAHSARKLHPTNYHRYVRFDGELPIALGLLSERPLILVTAHYGNFELASFVLTLFGYKIYSVARPLDNPYLDRWINRFRGSRGQTILSKQGDYERILDLLAGGAKVTFVADQYAGSKGCWIDFFGRPASAHKAIALFALQHDAPIYVGYCRRAKRPLHYDLVLHATHDPRTANDPKSNVTELTQWYTSAFEELIREAPEQYWWLHRRWKDNRWKRRRAKQAA